MDEFGKPGVLVVHVCPPYSRGYGGKSDKEVVTEIMELLRAMLGAVRTLAPHRHSRGREWEGIHPVIRVQYSHAVLGVLAASTARCGLADGQCGGAAHTFG
jgi:hypothetical protein